MIRERDRPETIEVLRRETAAWWQENLGDRIPPDWPLMSYLAEKYLSEVLGVEPGETLEDA